jgi:sugar lactone lactonase YvrE
MNRTGFPHEIPPTVMDIECLAATESQIGESPVWSAAERCVYFVDIPGKLVHQFRIEDRSLGTSPVPELVTAVAPRRSGGLLALTEHGVALFDPATRSFTRVLDIAAEPDGNRFNDGKCDPRGRFWAGTMSQTMWDAPCGTLYRFGGNLIPEPMLKHIRCSNGLGWSPDRQVFYYVESFAHVIHAFDYDVETGAISNGRPFATLNPDSGAFPDGLTVDADGFVWNAQPVFGRLVRYDPKGAIDRIVETPVSRCTSCCFGGDDLATMYVTSARQSLSADQLNEEPLAGALFAFRPGVPGVEEVPFAG